ncbi:MAG: glycosyltransferase [Acidimicrobiales bacterium]
MNTTVRSLAVLSLHTSPLEQPGSGDSGGMNVYVRELVASLAQAGVRCNVYVRRWRADLPDTVDVEPGFRVLHVPAGPLDLAKERLVEVVPEFTAWVQDHIEREGDTALLHANYWLSGVAGHEIKHRLNLPLVCTFHTLARVKAETGDTEPERRIEAETMVVRCADAMIANSAVEAAQLQRLYGAELERVEVVPPGVDHAFFSPGPRGGARRALGLEAGPAPLLLFVGRIQPLKGLDVAIGALAELADRRVRLLVVGGASGPEGESHAVRCRELAEELGVAERIVWRPPQPHHLLSTYYRAADVVLVPSRSESFGLVALEAAACGTPVVAAAVGGLLSLVDDQRTGLLVEGRNPTDYAKAVAALLEDHALAAEMSVHAAQRGRGFTWSTTAARLRRLYGDLSARSLIECGA